MSSREKRNRKRGSAGQYRKTGDDFLNKNRQKEGIVETGSGLQYQILEEGEGEKPEINSRVIIHQRAQLTNGTIIEDTYKENQPSEAEMSELIEGYQEGLLLMSKGARYKFYIPPELAWGKKGTSNKIPPNAVLIFDVRLLDFW